mmetsp:Transcript_23119/g.22282  ORF Transcript_23119/g.22282 Transcript_23119/m.22282 type:complete len:232 (+) Transcript_23119:172-867(+)
MNRFFSTVILILLFVCQSNSSPVRNYQSSSTIDDNTLSTFLDNRLFNPIFLATSTESEIDFGTELTAFIDENPKKKLKWIKLASFAGFLLCGNGFLKATTTVGRILYGVLSADSFRLSYNCFTKNYCKIICEQTALGLGKGILSRVAFVTSSMMMVGEREVKSKVLFYGTITIGSYRRLQTMFDSILENFIRKEIKREEEKDRDILVKEIKKMEKGMKDFSQKAKDLWNDL